MSKPREFSLDIFRGFAVAAMIMVNTPGSWEHIYAPLQHSAWHGITPTDLVFPFFLFAVGNALYFALDNSTLSIHLITKAAKRSLLLFGIGLLLNAYPFHNSLQDLRIMGVLQRIAICYFFAVILVLSLPKKYLFGITCCIPFVYWLIMGTDPISWEVNHNLVSFVDALVLGKSHMYSGFGMPFDPEGLLSTVCALCNVLFGFLTAEYLRHKVDVQAKIMFLVKYGLLALMSGFIWSMYLPINKPLWSGSYALISTGFAQLALALIIFSNSRAVLKSTMTWFRIYGSNPLFIYALAWLYAAALSQVIVFEYDAQHVSLNEWLFGLFRMLLPEKMASLLYALITVAFFYGISKWLYDRKIFIKV